jgi:ParB family chromosome partitioning protein
MTTTRKALGRGLDALFGDTQRKSDPTTSQTGEDLLEIDIDLIDPNPEQPRTNFGAEKLAELARSIKSNGLVQPVLVRRTATGRFQLIAGERRWRAAQLANLHKIQAVIREVPDERLLEYALVENIQRQELNPIEEAHAYQRLIEVLKLTQEEVAERVGKDRSSVANYLRLLKLAPQVRKLIEDDQLQMGHARALAALESPELQTRLGRDIARRRLSVRQAEAAVKRLASARVNVAGSTANSNDANIRAAELKLKRFLGTQVKIRFAGRSGKIEVSFESMSDLDRIYSIIIRKTGVAPQEQE